MLGGRSKDQHGPPLPLRVRHHVIEPLSHRLGASQVMVLVEQLVAAAQLGGFGDSYLQALQDGLLLGVGLANGFVHGPELGKSRHLVQQKPLKSYCSITYAAR